MDKLIRMIGYGIEAKILVEKMYIMYRLYGNGTQKMWWWNTTSHAILTFNNYIYFINQSIHMDISVRMADFSILDELQPRTCTEIS